MAYNQAEIDKMLKLHEGSEYNDRGQMISYMDTEDHLTVGYGHKVLKGDKDMFGMPITSTNQVISQAQANEWFKEDTANAIKQATSIKGFDTLTPNRQKALIDMTFNMGIGWKAKFPKAVSLYEAAINSTNPEYKRNLFKAMSNEVLYRDGRDLSKGYSKYRKQTKNRAEKIVRWLRDG